MEEIKKSENTIASTLSATEKLGIPDDVTRFFEKALHPADSRALVFENDKQRNLGVLKKGLLKPGQISFEVLRRAVNAVPIARICVNVLKEKITKTKWVIKTIDPMAKADAVQIKEITDLLKTPNEQDSTRSFLDKALEDLLILDAVAIEKTRYPDGKLAQLYTVDASTIRPVFDEYGNQEIEVPLPNGKTPPVSYLQIFNNSMYGGPESGDIVAAWSKKDFIYFHMHPQGSIASFGYGLSPIEGVLSVVSNLLNSDNYNGSYFDTGAFPPIILQLAESLSQRDMERYREYIYQQIEGEFHRPAIVAGGGEMKVHNLKDLSNRDMQFMEYTSWLSKLLAAAYGLSPEDIGLTDTTGSKNVSETQKDLSEAKGYGSILHLIKEIINHDIIWKDFGYADIEFDWIAIDSTDPKTATEIQDIKLKNGTMTLNEAREKNGDLPYEEWADQPMILGSDGYTVIHTDDHESVEEESTVAGEKVYSKSQFRKDNIDDLINTIESYGWTATRYPKRKEVSINGKSMKEADAVKYMKELIAIKEKSISKAVYLPDGIKAWFDDRGYGQPFIWCNVLTGVGQVYKPPVAVNLISQDLEVAITADLAKRGLNVKPVSKQPYGDITANMGAMLATEFDKYCNMTSEYDSEKWRAKFGGSRKYPYYMVSEYIDGFAVGSNQIRDDMKRDPTSYTQAIIDLANLWNIEKELVLGDRRVDQYIITKDKRAFGFDYQFKGDFKRWEDTSESIQKFLVQIPQLYKLFIEKTSEQPKEKSMMKKLWSKISKEIAAAATKPVETFQETPVLFGAMFPSHKKETVKELFRLKDLAALTATGYQPISYRYEFNESVKALQEQVDKHPSGSGGVFFSEDSRGLVYSIYFKA
jgi:HK97 family phage portal protein